MSKRDELARVLDEWTEQALKTHGRFDTTEMVTVLLDALMEPGEGVLAIGARCGNGDVRIPRVYWQAMLKAIKDGK